MDSDFVLGGVELQGEIVKSDNVWMIVFPREIELGKLLKEFVQENFKDKFGKEFELKEPASWKNFPVLREKNGLHVTLTEKPKNLTRTVTVRIRNATFWKEQERKNSFGNITNGFVVLLVDIEDKDIKCDKPCHISIAQSFKIIKNS